MKNSIIALFFLLVFGLSSIALSQSGGSSSCLNFYYPSEAKLKSLGGMIVGAGAGPNGVVPYNPSSNYNCPGLDPSANLDFEVPLASVPYYQSFPVCSSDTNSNANGTGSATAKLNYLPKVHTTDCTLMFDCRVYKNFEGSASIVQSQCVNNPQPTATASAGGTLVNTLELSFMVRDTGTYCLKASGSNGGCPASGQAVISGYATIYDNLGQPVGTVVDSVGPYAVINDSEPVNLATGIVYTIVYFWSMSDSLDSPLSATCIHPAAEKKCDSGSSFKVQITKDTNCN